jgi:predicted house-cleaning noncanonical NTP pyrophosphatase (MazG superfamily)
MAPLASVAPLASAVPLASVAPLASATVAPASAVPVVAEPRRPEHRGPPPKYVSKFKKVSDNVDDTILNTILLGKLNKFSESNYPEIKEFITHIISSGQTDMITCFMKVVFEKAAAEEIFCPLYAKLLSELSASYPVLLTEMATLYAQYMEIFEEVVETSATSYNEVCKRNVEKKYRRGYSQFLAELTRHHVIPTETFMKVVETILRQVEVNAPLKEATKLNEELADCLMKIVKAIRNANNAEETTDRIRTMLTQEALLRIQPLTLRDPVMEGISNKSRFTFMDIHDAIQKL